jgi:hypothetical protein
MEIRFDPDTDSIERIDIISKLIDLSKEEAKLNKDTKPELTLKKKLTPAEDFLLAKYRFYLARAILVLNTGKDIQEEDRCPEIKDVIYVDKESLIGETIKALKKDNVTFINQKILNIAFDGLINKTHNYAQQLGIQFHVESKPDEKMMRILF